MDRPGRPHLAAVRADPDPVFGPVAVPDACLAVLTEAQAVLPEIDSPQAGTRLQQALAAGQCPRDAGQSGTVASRLALLRARAALLQAVAEPEET